MNLEELNHAPAEVAESAFKSCCGSATWAIEMTDARPFPDLAELLRRADDIWRKLEKDDWLEAFAGHPQIGTKKAALSQTKQSADWSQAEQSGAGKAAAAVLSELETANRLYREKFGFIFIVCATGKSAEEMLGLCSLRFENDPDSEIRIAANEQSKITAIRLKKLII